jgi:hypothetical protein
MTKTYMDYFYQKIKNATEYFEEAKRISSRQHNWITGASIGVLGYFFAILIQFKNECGIPYHILAIIILSCLGIIIIFGLIFKLIYENKESKILSISLFQAIINAWEYLVKHDPGKEDECQRNISEINGIINKIEKNPTKRKYDYPPNFLLYQLILFCIALTLLVIYFSMYLFN